MTRIRTMRPSRAVIEGRSLTGVRGSTILIVGYTTVGVLALIYYCASMPSGWIEEQLADDGSAFVQALRFGVFAGAMLTIWLGLDLVSVLRSKARPRGARVISRVIGLALTMVSVVGLGRLLF